MTGVWVSVLRALGGFGLGVVTAVPLGILLGWYKGVDRFLNPLLQLLRQTRRRRRGLNDGGGDIHKF